VRAYAVSRPSTAEGSRMESKRFTFKFDETAEDTGSFKAVFSTFNVIDKDGDVTTPGAIKSGTPVRIMQYGHNLGGLPVGRGVVQTSDTEAWVDGKFFLGSTIGRDTYETVKAMGDLQEWSYVFRVTDAGHETREGKSVRVIKDTEVYSVDPVFIGAGVNTRTAAVKSSMPFSEHVEYAGTLIEGVGEFIRRTESRKAVRATEGRTIGADDRAGIEALVVQLTDAKARLEEVLRDESKQAESEYDEQVRAVARAVLAIQTNR
jgi:HK97 family phage prohead protease